MKSKIRIYALVICITAILTSCTPKIAQFNMEPKTYYVSSESGSLENEGLSPYDALLNIEQVNELNLNPGDTVLFERGSIFRGSLLPVSGSEKQRITYSSYGEGDLPVIMNSVSVFDIIDNFEKLDSRIYGIPSTKDIGNIIFNDNEYFGVKKFALYELENPLDYFYDRNSGVLFIYGDEHFINLLNGQSSKYHSVEFCLTENIVELDSKHDLVFKDIAIKNGSAHGFGASNTHRVRIENCQISYIGGGFLHYNDDNQPVRFGNAVELFNSGSYIEVIGCEIFEIFDTAVTNQGMEKGGNQTNITYSDNTIYNCGMAAYELWLKGKNTTMSDISFENNTVSNIGFSFSKTQGRDDNFGLGYFIINFGNDAKIKNLSIENNTFNNVYNVYGYGSLLLLIDIKTQLEDDTIYKSCTNNEVNGATYEVVYTKDGELLFQE